VLFPDFETCGAETYGWFYFDDGWKAFDAASRKDLSPTQHRKKNEERRKKM